MSGTSNTLPPLYPEMHHARATIYSFPYARVHCSTSPKATTIIIIAPINHIDSWVMYAQRGRYARSGNIPRIANASGQHAARVRLNLDIETNTKISFRPEPIAKERERERVRRQTVMLHGTHICARTDRNEMEYTLASIRTFQCLSSRILLFRWAVWVPLHKRPPQAGDRTLRGIPPRWEIVHFHARSVDRRSHSSCMAATPQRYSMLLGRCRRLICAYIWQTNTVTVRCINPVIFIFTVAKSMLVIMSLNYTLIQNQ